MLDVGQGDAAFISTPGGKHILIDTGRWEPGYNSGEAVILPFLKANGIDRLNAVFLSHPHADHIGGMVELIGKIPIGVIYNSGYRYDSDLYKTYLKEAARYDIPVKSIQAGDLIRLDTSMRVFVYGPTPMNHYSNPNNHSLIIELMYGKAQFLFVGDASSAQEKLIARHYPELLNSDFLKVGHHGSKTSSTTIFLQSVSPQISAVSLALHNRFTHPDPQAVQRLKKSGTELFFTSQSGALQFVSNGRTIKRIKWR